MMKKIVLILACIIGFIPAVIILAVAGVAIIVVLGKLVLLLILGWIVYRIFKHDSKVRKRTIK